MTGARRTRNHEEIRRWVEARGGAPAVLKGTRQLRLDFQADADGLEGSTAVLELVDWELWLALFEEGGLSFLYSPDLTRRYYALVRASPEDLAPGPRREGLYAPGVELTTVVVARDDEEDAWAVEVRGGDLRELHADHEDAVQRGRELARRYAPAELILYRTDGTRGETTGFGSEEG